MIRYHGGTINRHVEPGEKLRSDWNGLTAHVAVATDHRGHVCFVGISRCKDTLDGEATNAIDCIREFCGAECPQLDLCPASVVPMAAVAVN